MPPEHGGSIGSPASLPAPLPDTAAAAAGLTVKAQRVRDVAVQHRLAPLVHRHQVGHLQAALVAAKGGAAPGAPRDQLEGPGGQLLAPRRHADNDGLAPAAVRALQGRPHHLHVADALKGVVDAPASGALLDEHLQAAGGGGGAGEGVRCVCGGREGGKGEVKHAPAVCLPSTPQRAHTRTPLHPAPTPAGWACRSPWG